MITGTEIIEQPAFYITGVSVRTINQNGQSKKDMMALWTRFMTDNLVQQIKDRVSDDIYCVYTDYKNDYMDFYTAVLGCRVNSLEHIPNGFTGINIPAAKYQVYSLAGKFPENVRLAWQEIWDSNVSRKYTVDFDLYSAGAKSFEETEVKVYLAVK
jgi:predicted transcriptional regulator YdeE